MSQNFDYIKFGMSINWIFMFKNLYEPILHYINNARKVNVFKSRQWPMWYRPWLYWSLYRHRQRYTHEFNWLVVVKPQTRLFSHEIVDIKMFRLLPL